MPNAKPQKANNPPAGSPNHIGENDANQKLYSITELARELSISTRTIRFYETKGLISPDRVGGNRVFQNRDRARLLLILRGKRLGFTLKDISEYLALYNTDETQVSQVQLLNHKVEKRLEKLNGQLQDLQTIIAELEDMRAQTQQSLAKQ